MEIHNMDEEEIRPLLFNYFFHFILFILIFILHYIIYYKIFWISEVYGKLFIICAFLGLIYCIYPIIPMLLILLKYFKLKTIYIFKRLSFIFLILAIIIGLLVAAVILINTINTKEFCKECPFNISIDHLNYIFSQYYYRSPKVGEIEDSCKSRRCILDSKDLNEEYPYSYLCNYDPSFDFKEEETYKRKFPNGTEITTKDQVICVPVEISYNEIYFNNAELYSYLDLCYYLTEFYYCKRFNEPRKRYELNLGIECPESNYLFLVYILCVLIIIIDIVITMLPWGVEFISLKRIIQIMQTSRRKPNSNNSTAKSSVISNNEETFKKENTIVLIQSLENPNINENVITINKIKNNNNKKLCIKDSTNEILNNNSINALEEDDKNKTIARPIILFQNSERFELKKNLELNPNPTNLTNSNVINVFNINNNQQDLNISNDLQKNQNPNKSVRDKIEEENENKK